MYWHVENVMQHARMSGTLTGADWQLLVTIAHRADVSGVTTMSYGYLSDLAGMSRRHAMRIAAQLADAGHVTVNSVGAGRGGRTVFALAANLCQRNGDKCDTAPELMVTNETSNGDAMSPLDPLMVTNETRNGDTMSHSNSKKKKKEKEEKKGGGDYRQLEDVFDARGYWVPPPSGTDYATNWRAFFERWLELYPRDELQTAIGAVLDDMAGKGLTVVGPKSLRNTLPDYMAKKRAAQPAGATSAYGDLDYGTL